MKHASWRSLSREESNEHLRDAVEQSQLVDRRKFYLAIEMNGSDDFIGDAGFAINSENDTGGIAELGYFLRKKYWGIGYGSEAAGMLITYVFTHTKMHKVIACCSKENVASERVMKKCGMKKEAETRKGRLQQGCWCDGLEYGILKEEWEMISEKQIVEVIAK